MENCPSVEAYPGYSERCTEDASAAAAPALAELPPVRPQWQAPAAQVCDLLTANLGNSGGIDALAAMRGECRQAGSKRLYLIDCVCNAADRDEAEGYGAVTANIFPGLCMTGTGNRAPYETLVPESEATSDRFPVTDDGQWDDYQAPVPRNPRWRGSLQRLRVGPTN